MIGVVLVSHANIAKEMLYVIQHIVGPQQNIIAISIFPEDDMEKKRQEILESVKKVDSGKGVIVLTDMFGGTPSNLAISVMEKEKIDLFNILRPKDFNFLGAISDNNGSFSIAWVDVSTGCFKSRNIVEDNNSNKLIGTMTVYCSEREKIADVGILIGDKKIAGKGYGKDSWCTLIEWLKNKYPDIIIFFILI